MDFNDLLKDALLSGDTVNTVSRKAGTSKKDTETVINAALPALLNSLNGAANKPSGSAGALLNTVQEEEDEQVQGTNILSALLGQGGAGSLASSVSGSTGVGTSASNAILIALAPMILKALAGNIFGTSTQSAKPTQSKPQQNAGDSLLGALLGAALGGSTQSAKPTQQAKPQQSAGEGLMGALLGAALGGTTQSAKPTQQAKPQQSGTDQLLGALLGAALGGNTKAAAQKKEGATESAKKTTTGAKKTTSAKAGAGTAGKDTQGAKKVIKKVE